MKLFASAPLKRPRPYMEAGRRILGNTGLICHGHRFDQKKMVIHSGLYHLWPSSASQIIDSMGLYDTTYGAAHLGVSIGCMCVFSFRMRTRNNFTRGKSVRLHSLANIPILQDLPGRQAVPQTRRVLVMVVYIPSVDAPRGCSSLLLLGSWTRFTSSSVYTWCTTTSSLSSGTSSRF